MQRGSLRQQGGIEATSQAQTKSQPQRLLPDRGQVGAICYIRGAPELMQHSCGTRSRSKTY